MCNSPHLLVIGNPENRRVAFFQESLSELGEPAADVLSYTRLLDSPEALKALLRPNTIIRIESPGEKWEVEQRIIAWGGCDDAMACEYKLGKIGFSAPWFRGFTRVMEHISRTVAEYHENTGNSSVSWFNHPDDIVMMFDKSRCKSHTAPHTLPLCPAFSCYDEFFAFAKQQNTTRFFIKLNSSSSASGVAAYEYNRRLKQEQITTTVELTTTASGNHFYNSLKVRKYREPGTIRLILDFLFSEGALAEQWVPKQQHEGHSFDLRVVGIAGKRRHSIARLSRSPITNLHLGNSRCSVEELEIPAEMWQRIDTVTRETMARFPGSLYAGLDILIPAGGAGPVLLEANSFGDLLPGLLHRGVSTYRAELEAVFKRIGYEPKP